MCNSTLRPAVRSADDRWAQLKSRRILKNMPDIDVAPIIAVVEHRDEVFARLWGDLRRAGCAIERFTTAGVALQRYRRHRFALVLASERLPDQSGWLLAAKLTAFDRQCRIWVYESGSSQGAHSLGALVKAERVLYYAGNVWNLSDQVQRLMSVASRTDLLWPMQVPWAGEDS